MSDRAKQFEWNSCLRSQRSYYFWPLQSGFLFKSTMKMLAAHGNTKQDTSCCCHMRLWVPSTGSNPKTSWPDWLVSLEPLWFNRQFKFIVRQIWSEFIYLWYWWVRFPIYPACSVNHFVRFGVTIWKGRINIAILFQNNAAENRFNMNHIHTTLGTHTGAPWSAWCNRFIHLHRPRNWKNFGLMNAAHNGFRTTRSSRSVGDILALMLNSKIIFSLKQKLNILTQPGEWPIVGFAIAAIWGWSWKSQRLSNQL